MKSSEVREKSESDLQALEKDLARQLWQAQFDNQTNQLDDSAKVGRIRRDIARVKTILTERAQAPGASAKAAPAKAAPKTKTAKAAKTTKAKA